MTYNVAIYISVGDPCISPANHLFCGHYHGNENVSGPNHGPGPALDRSLDVAAVNALVQNVHEDEDSSNPSRCVDDSVQGTHDDLDHSRHVDHHRVDRHPCDSEMVAAMAFGCHHARGEEASPDEGDVVGMVTDCHLAHGGAANRGDNDEAVLTSDDENGGRESHLTNSTRCRNLTT